MSGNYETEIQKADNYINDRTCKRLLSAMQLGVIITHGNGHRWLYSYPHDENEASLNEQLVNAGHPMMRSKCYGTVADALDRVDGALKVLGQPSLLESFEADAS